VSRLSRRDFALLAAAAGFAPTAARAAPPVPLIIAEGGAPEERIEDTRPALDLAIAEGADLIQVNLVPSKDGLLVARRDNDISASTDVSARPEFAERKTSKTIDGATIDGWFAEDFTLAELKTLYCRERLPAMRPQNLKYNGKEPILSLPEVLQLARTGSVRTARTIGVCLRMLHPKYFEGQDLAIEDRLAAELSLEGYIAAAAAVWVQAAEPDSLKAFGRLSPLRRMQLIETGDAPAGAPDVTHAGMTTQGGLAEVRTHAEAIAPDQALLFDALAAIFPAPTTLALDAHDAGLQVFSRTARIENAFLPPALRKGDKKSPAFPSGHGDVDKLMLSLFLGGVDGVATDLPATAVKARAAAIQAIERRAAKGG
jgi:glycerophosphoryl diester phosphodiesterase